ncbi:MAG: peroxiredoxin [Rhodothalassiaceae bacterium]|nr:MAG: peroxiredoxin [Rhodothalassiaceae bacterium]
MTIKPGDPLPDVELFRMGPNGPETFRLRDEAGEGLVVIFGLPGAFTPTCSAKHLPGFIEKADELKAKGVKKIACVSVNDAFVMDAWGKAQGADGKVEMWADGNGTLARALGLAFDAGKFGMGERMQRFAMIVENGRVKDVFVEKPGEFSVSSAEHVLARL